MLSMMLSALIFSMAARVSRSVSSVSSGKPTMKKAPTSIPACRQRSTAGYAFSMVCPFFTLRSIRSFPDSIPILTPHAAGAAHPFDRPLLDDADGYLAAPFESATLGFDQTAQLLDVTRVDSEGVIVEVDVPDAPLHQ